MTKRWVAIGLLLVPVSVALPAPTAGANDKLAPDGPAVQRVTFKGAKHLKEEELRNLTGVRAGMTLNPNLNRQGCVKVEEKYEEMGRSFARCKLVKGGDSNDTEVVYEITEGPKVQVKDIRFVGNTFVSGAQLATQIKSSSRWYGWVGGTYNRQMAESAIAELTKYFREFGYRDVKVSLETQRTTDSGEVVLIFHAQEGKRFKP